MRPKIASETTPLLNPQHEKSILAEESFVSINLNTNTDDDLIKMIEDLIVRLSNYRDILIINKSCFCNINSAGALVGLISSYGLMLDFKQTGDYNTFVSAVFLGLFGLCNAYAFISNNFVTYEYESYSISQLKEIDAKYLEDFLVCLNNYQINPEKKIEDQLKKEMEVLATKLAKQQTLVNIAKQDLEKFKVNFFNQYGLFHQNTSVAKDLQSIKIEEIADAENKVLISL